MCLRKDWNEYECVWLKALEVLSEDGAVCAGAARAAGRSPAAWLMQRAQESVCLHHCAFARAHFISLLQPKVLLHLYQWSSLLKQNAVWF